MNANNRLNNNNNNRTSSSSSSEDLDTPFTPAYFLETAPNSGTARAQRSLQRASQQQSNSSTPSRELFIRNTASIQVSTISDPSSAETSHRVEVAHASNSSTSSQAEASNTFSTPVTPVVFPNFEDQGDNPFGSLTFPEFLPSLTSLSLGDIEAHHPAHTLDDVLAEFQPMWITPSFGDTNFNIHMDSLLQANLPLGSSGGLTISSSSTEHELDDLAYQDLISVDGLNKDRFLNDPTMPEWNNLSQIEGDISGSDWTIIGTSLEAIFAITHPGKDPVYLRTFLKKCMESADARTAEGKQMIRKRVESVVNHLMEMNAYRNLTNDKKEKETALTMLHEALNIVQEGGMKCPDRAIVFLVHLENHIKLLKNPDYLANVIVQMFKLHSLNELTSDNYAENIETTLHNLLRFNKVLGLGQPKGGVMLYASWAKQRPVVETLTILSKCFTLENLLNFTIQQGVFINRFETEMETNPAVLEARDAYIEVDTTETALAAEHAKDNFYKSKALELFQKAGFLQEFDVD